jgi:hypothetical protein
MPTFAKAPVGERSTGCKQTPNGLFIFLFKSSSAASAIFMDWQMEFLLRLLFQHQHPMADPVWIMHPPFLMWKYKCPTISYAYAAEIVRALFY